MGSELETMPCPNGHIVWVTKAGIATPGPVGQNIECPTCGHQWYEPLLPFPVRVIKS